VHYESFLFALSCSYEPISINPQASLFRHSLLALLRPLLLSWEAKHHGHHGRHLLATGLGLLLLPHVELHHLLLVMSELLLLHENDLLVIHVLLFRSHITSRWLLHHRHHGHHLGERWHRVNWLSNLRSLGLGGLFYLLFVLLELLGCLLFFG